MVPMDNDLTTIVMEKKGAFSVLSPQNRDATDTTQSIMLYIDAVEFSCAVILLTDNSYAKEISINFKKTLIAGSDTNV
ncbi:MAG: hypothetical protein ABIC04_06495 [Nanoarchaeota archaeon]